MKASERRSIIQKEQTNGRDDFPVSELYPASKNNTIIEYRVFCRRSDGSIASHRLFHLHHAKAEATRLALAGLLTGTVKCYFMGYA